MCMLLLTLTVFFFPFPIKTFSENNSLEINCLAFLSLFFLYYCIELSAGMQNNIDKTNCKKRI